MSFFQDIVSIFKKRDIPFIGKVKESDDVYTFHFKKPEDITWRAGQHGLFQITHKKIKNSTVPFTVAAAPGEKVIKITTRIGNNPSDFKKSLLALEEGMTVRMSGPVGSFYLKESSPSLFIAGGIGITPFRSMLKQIEAEDGVDGKQIKLLYMDSNQSYLFKDELDEIAEHTSVNVTYLDSRDGLYQEINQFMNVNKDHGRYFIAGPKSMVDSISGYLQNNRISKRNIKKDAFFGY